MKKYILFGFASLCITMFMVHNFAGTGVYSPLSSSGSKPGYSGDPAGGNLSCISCHTGPDPTIQIEWITSNIPETGYIPDSTYSITATTMMKGHSIFGFEVSPQNSDGFFLGTLINTGSETQLTSNTGYITHSNTGTNGEGSKTWTFNWKAPAPGAGPVTFYGAFLVANGNNNFNGDTTFLSTLSIDEDKPISANNKELQETFFVYPNPVYSILTIESLKSGSYDIYITNLSGQNILTQRMLKSTLQLDLSYVAKGTYFISIRSKDFVTTRKIVKL